MSTAREVIKGQLDKRIRIGAKLRLDFYIPKEKAVRGESDKALVAALNRLTVREVGGVLRCVLGRPYYVDDTLDVNDGRVLLRVYVPRYIAVVGIGENPMDLVFDELGGVEFVLNEAMFITPTRLERLHRFIDRIKGNTL